MAEITMSGLGSGMDYQSWIDALVNVEQSKIKKVSNQVSAVEKKQGAMSQMKNIYQTLQDSIGSFSSVLAADNIFEQKTATSSATDILSVKADANANIQNLSVEVLQLATTTVAQSANFAAKSISGDTVLGDVSSGNITDGTFSVYVNGKKNTIDISSSDKFEDVLEKLNNIDGVNAEIVDGKLNIKAENSGYNIAVGSSSDSSNFANVMSIAKDEETGEFTSSKPIFETSSSAALTSAKFAAGNVTEGTFTIGSKEFTINADTTLDSLIKEINKSDAGVSAFWNSNSGKMVLTAKDGGAVNINVEAGTSNFTDIMGFTESTWNADGSLASTKLASDTQELGKNAILSINGTTFTSATNSVTSDISGVKGLTLNLEKVGKSEVSVSQNVDSVVTAIEGFVNAYNSLMTATDTALDNKTGTLYGESILNSLRNSIRKETTSVVNVGGAYNSLAKIGISTGKPSSDLSQITTKLEIDKDALKEAIQNDPSSVKQLLTGEGGIFSKMKTTLDNALNTEKGYFTTKNSSYDKEIANLNKKITKMETATEAYRSRLEVKFKAMDSLISKLQGQATVFDSYFNQKSNNKK